MQANGIAEKEAKTANSKRVRKRTIRAMDGYGDANDQDEKAEYHVNKIKTRARSMRKIKTRALKGRPSTFFYRMQANDASARCKQTMSQTMHANDASKRCIDVVQLCDVYYVLLRWKNALHTSSSISGNQLN
jgi:hypothetical protein